MPVMMAEDSFLAPNRVKDSSSNPFAFMKLSNTFFSSPMEPKFADLIYGYGTK